MPAAYSIDLRQRVLDAYLAGEGSQRQLADRFKVSLSFVRDLMRQYRERETVRPKAHGGGAVAKLDDAARALVGQWVEQQPDLQLRELCERLEQACSIRVSSSTMCRVLQQLQLRLKKNLECH